jgi:hypothetical protein
VIALGPGKNGSGLGPGRSSQPQPGIIGQGDEDRQELPGRVAGKIDDRAESGSQRRDLVQQPAQRLRLSGQDDSQVVVERVTVLA